jgi:carboxyl-terminal processing protease
VSHYRKSRIYFLLPLLFAITLAVGILTGATMADGKSRTGSILSSVLKFKEILTYIERDYVDKVETDELVETAITKMLEKLDPHSVYIPSEDLAIAKSQLEGEFEGIGIEFNIIKDTIYVVAPIIGGPSEKVGLMSGDKIIKVDGSQVAGNGVTNKQVFNKLRGKKGSKVNVSILRKGHNELLDFEITRDKIPQHSVDVNYMVDNEVGYIKISRFAATTYDEFKEALTTLKSQGMQKLILDLQGNPGGYMDRAINMADDFLANNQLIVYTEGKESRYNQKFKAHKKGLFEDGALIVLIDEGSASASEIVAGALQDNDRGLIVGRRSFGKGLVQMPISLSDGSELRLTISRYYTPSGRSIQKPYDETSDYGHDIVSRFEHGEFFTKDSIKFNDSLKFETSKGRTVYGGGGIMPDFFVAIDTSKNTDYLKKLFTSNTIREYTLKYAEKNRKKLEKMSFDDYRKSFAVSDEMLDELIALAKSNKVEFKEKEFNKSKPVIQNNVKALIARNIWNSKGFYPIYNETNEVFQQALNLFQHAEELAAR